MPISELEWKGKGRSLPIWEKLQVLQGRIKEARKKQTELQVSSQYKMSYLGIPPGGGPKIRKGKDPVEGN